MMRRRSNAAAQFWEWGAGEGATPPCRAPRWRSPRDFAKRQALFAIADSASFSRIPSRLPCGSAHPDPLGLPIAHLQQLPGLASGYPDHIVEHGPVSTTPSTAASYAQNVRSSVRYWIASAMCLGSIAAAPSRSAIVRATFSIRSWARAVMPCWVIARSRRRSQSEESSQNERMWRGCICALQYNLTRDEEAKRLS